MNSEELHEFYFSPRIIRVIKSRLGMRHAGQKRELRVGFWLEILQDRDRLKCLDIDGTRTSLEETRWDGVDLIYVYLVQDRGTLIEIFGFYK